MARRYDTVTYIKLFPNTEGKGKAQYSNGNWQPYSAEQKVPADLHFEKASDIKYPCSPTRMALSLFASPVSLNTRVRTVSLTAFHSQL